MTEVFQYIHQTATHRWGTSYTMYLLAEPFKHVEVTSHFAGLRLADRLTLKSQEHLSSASSEFINFYPLTRWLNSMTKRTSHHLNPPSCHCGLVVVRDRKPQKTCIASSVLGNEPLLLQWMVATDEGDQIRRESPFIAARNKFD